MDLRVYYKKIREAMEAIPGEFAVLVSRETPDGGQPGVLTEAHRALAARLLVDGRVRLATMEEDSQYRASEEQIRQKALRDAAPPRLQVAVISEKDIDALQSGRPVKPHLK